jgi:hypothetical protein
MRWVVDMHLHCGHDEPVYRSGKTINRDLPRNEDPEIADQSKESILTGLW